MNDLTELLHILSKQKTYSIQIVSENFDGDTKLQQLYGGLTSGQYETEEEASSDIYGLPPNSKKFIKLRTQLKNRLINTIFFIDKKSAQFNEYQRAYYNCCKDWAAMKMLLGREARVAAIQLAHKIIKQTQKFEFTILTLDTARVLRMHYSMIEPDMDKFDRYHEMVREQSQIMAEEAEAEFLYESLVYRYVENKSTQQEIREEATRYARRLKAVSDQYATHQLRLCLYLIEVIQHMSINDYRSTLEVCERAIAFFKTKAYRSKVTMITFLYQQLACQIQLRMLPEGKETAAQCLELMQPGPSNWFKAMELSFILNLHSEEYTQAYDQMHKAMRNSRFKFLSKSIKEAWYIYEAYARFLFEIDKVEIEQDYKKPGKFRLNKFLNEVPTFSKDRSGMNVPIMVIQFMFLILHKKYDTLIDKEEATRKYISRYLKQPETRRSELFFKMLMLFPACSFDQKTIVEKAKPLIEELESIPLEKANQSFEIEILPYMTSWEMLLTLI